MLEHLDSLPTGWIAGACALAALVLGASTTIFAVRVGLRVWRTIPVAEDLVTTHMEALNERALAVLEVAGPVDTRTGGTAAADAPEPAVPVRMDPAQGERLREAVAGLGRSVRELRFLVTEPARARRRLLRTIADLVLPTGTLGTGERSPRGDDQIQGTAERGGSGA